MSIHSRRWLLVFALGFILVSTGTTREPPAAAPAPGGFKLKSSPVGSKGKKWAVVVGINYSKEDRPADAGPISPLRHARKDAEEFHKLLIASFGYHPDQARLLVDKDATYEKIASLLNQGLFLKENEVKEEDSVLFYFSGHGHLQRVAADQPSQPYLLASDVQTDADRRPDLSKAVELSKVVRDLNSLCKARHKLLILDCCHSGAVFHLEARGAAGRFDHLEKGGAAFREPAFQAISASRSSELASDGRDGHSPFTAALLRTMKLLGREASKPGEDRHFTAERLFEKMNLFLQSGGLRGESQSAQCKRLTADQGHFHFLLGDNAQFPTVFDDKDRNLLIAMVPSTFGNWWADEIPWFMPGIRHHIVNEVTPSRSSQGQDLINRRELEEAAKRALKKAKEDSKTSAKTRQQFEVMERVFNAVRSGRRWDQQEFQNLLAEFEMATCGDPDAAHPTDLHYLAVLYQKQKKFKQAEKNYKAAEKRYQDLCGPDGGDGKDRSLWALCLFDHGLLELLHLRTNGGEDAVKLFQDARDLYKTESAPKPFEMFALLKEADAYRKRGLFGLCNLRFERALFLAQEWDPEQTHLLTAAIHKHRAWSYMETWDILLAVEQFQMARAILDRAAGPAGDGQRIDESTIDPLHIRHGLAMAERFQGRPDEARQQYRALTPDIARVIRDLENQRVELPNYTELRYLLYDRLVNSLERQADCSLFGLGDLAEAADVYRRALRECSALAPASVEQQRKDLLYRRAIALSMPAGEGAGPLDLELAQRLCAQAEKIELASEDNRLRIVKCLATTLVRPAPSGPALGESSDAPDRFGDLCKLLEGLRTGPGGHERDVLERLMFAYKYLIEAGRGDGATRFRTLEHADDLLKLCRSACQSDQPDPYLLKYLRPYFDVAFRAKRDLAPHLTKELIEIAWEATRGVPYEKQYATKQKAADGVMAVYFAGGECHLLVDAPGLSRCFTLKDVWALDDVKEAALMNAHPLPLPDEIRTALRQIRGQCKLECRWRDPCHGLGYSTVAIRPYPVMMVNPVLLHSSASSSRLHLRESLKPILTAHGLAKEVEVIKEDEKLLRFDPAGPRGVERRSFTRLP